MKVLFATSEAFPFAVSGGLGDVSYALPKALRKKLLGVRVIMPLYSKIPQHLREKMRFITSIGVPVAWRSQYCGIFEAEYDGVTYIFLDNEHYFKRGGMYGEYDDAERFAFFSRAVLEAIPYIDFKPDLIHCNDWQTAMVPTYYKLFYFNRPGFENIKTVFTIHNIQYQGRYGKELVSDVLGIPQWASSIVEYDKDVNMLKSAIESADAVTTVSRTYAQEILNPWFAYTLDRILVARQGKLRGIVNGIDTDTFNAETDPHIAANFSASNIRGKARNKTELQKELGLPVEKDIPLMVMVTRLAGHKGLDLVKYMFDEIMKCKIQLAILGTGEPEYEWFFGEKAAQYPDKFKFVCDFNGPLSHRFYAGADMFLMPSKQEPCGLSQMIALRYGTVPIVRSTGGLADTIRDAGEENGVGYTFKSYNGHDMFGAISRALGAYEQKKVWREIIRNGMESDLTWESSAKEYIKLYNELTGL